MKTINIAAALFLPLSATGAFAAPLAERLSAVSDQSAAAAAARTPEAAWSGAGTILDGTPPAAPAPVVVEPAIHPRDKTGFVPGLKNGARAGGWVGFGGTLKPAVELLSEGFGRNMSRSYDGPRSGNGNGGWYTAAGVALGVILYIPALVIGGVFALGGAAAGATSELIKPGSTEKWDGESVIS